LGALQAKGSSPSRYYTVTINTILATFAVLNTYVFVYPRFWPVQPRLDVGDFEVARYSKSCFIFVLIMPLSGNKRYLTIQIHSSFLNDFLYFNLIVYVSKISMIRYKNATGYLNTMYLTNKIGTLVLF
jgi:hypothetical protein